jgi:hypothetical protein
MPRMCVMRLTGRCDLATWLAQARIVRVWCSPCVGGQPCGAGQPDQQFVEMLGRGKPNARPRALASESSAGLHTLSRQPSSSGESVPSTATNIPGGQQ